MRVKNNATIRYTYFYVLSNVMVFVALVFGGMLAIGLLYKTIGYAGDMYLSSLSIGTLALGIILRIRVRFRVYIEQDGIHVVSKSNKYNFLLPWKEYNCCKIFKARSGREPSCVLLAKEIPPDLLYCVVSEEYPQDQEIRKYDLEYNLKRLEKGELSVSDFEELNVHIFEFYAPIYYQRFERLWRNAQSPM